MLKQGGIVMTLPVDETKNRLKKALSIRNMKPVELSEKTGIPKSAISQYMSGYAKPKQDRIYLICKALDINEAWLMGFDVQMERKQISKETAEKDIELLHKMSLLNERDRKLVLDMIDSMIANQNNGTKN